MITISRGASTLWWQVYPLGFLGATPEISAPEAGSPGSEGEATGAAVVPRLAGLTNWLDYLVELGATGLALGPVFAATSHGYDTVDHRTIDPRLGDQKDFRDLIEAAHARGVRVLLDGVFNHVGEQHPAFRAVLAGGPEHPDNELFRIDWTGPEPVWDCFEGHRHLVTLNHASSRVVDWVADVMNHWLDAGADGWRLDAAYAVPTAFWNAVTVRVRARHPNVYLLGEVIHGDYAEFVAQTGFDSVTEYELWKATWSSIVDHNWHELVWTLGRHNEFTTHFVPWTFIGNHDVTRIVSQIGGPRRAGHALVVLCTVAGTPAIYYGDEQALPGVKEERIGGDDAIRPQYPADPSFIGDGGLAEGGAELRRLHQELLGFRSRSPWLTNSRTEVLAVTNDQLLYRQSPADSTDDAQPAVLVALNLADHPWNAPVRDYCTVAVVSAHHLLPGHGDPASAPVHAEEDGVQTVLVPAEGWVVLVAGARDRA